MTVHPSTQPSDRASYSALVNDIRSTPEQRISFAAYMDWALYHPEHGYYSSHAEKIGARGDFVTSPHLGHDFGELLAVQFVQLWDILGRPQPFHLIEMGAGQGLLAHDILRHLYQCYSDCFAAVEYVIIEKSAALIAEQRQRLGGLAQQWGRLRWCDWDAIAPDSLVGCCFSNELVDAFPVHVVEKRDGALCEVYVTAEAEPDAMHVPGLAEALGPLSSDRILTYFERNGIDWRSDRYPDGYRTEVNLAVDNWLTTVAQRLQRGYVMTIDYGYTADRYYAPTRLDGTLQCYYRHAHHSDPYRYLGRQDLTAHVNITDLQRLGDRLGLVTIGHTQQGLWLMALGLGDRLALLSNPDTAPDVQTIFQRRDALHALIDPNGLGNFQVLVQAKGLTETEAAQPLQGFSQPSLF
jgi:SAM-dependent MidA family methyltransferase